MLNRMRVVSLIVRFDTIKTIVFPPFFVSYGTHALFSQCEFRLIVLAVIQVADYFGS